MGGKFASHASSLTDADSHGSKCRRGGTGSIYSKEITFTDLTFDEVAPDADQATVRFKVDAIIDLPTRRPVDGILHVDSRWEKQEGSWLLNRLSWTESPR